MQFLNFKKKKENKQESAKIKIIEEIIFFIVFFFGIVWLEFPLSILNGLNETYTIFIGEFIMYIFSVILFGYCMILVFWLIIMIVNTSSFFIYCGWNVLFKVEKINRSDCKFYN